MMHTLALALALAAAASSAAVTKRDAFDGQATYFYQGGNAGSCGDVHADSDYIVAMSSDAYGYNAKCGATVTITVCVLPSFLPSFSLLCPLLLWVAKVSVWDAGGGLTRGRTRAAATRTTASAPPSRRSSPTAA